jgi:hypothetical protein
VLFSQPRGGPISTFGIVALSILVGAFALTLLGVSVALIFLMFQANKLAKGYSLQFTQSTLDLRTLVTSTQSDLSFKIAQVNGEEMKKSSDQFDIAVRTMTKCVSRMEIAALAMGDMATSLLSDQSIARNSLTPDEYAQPDGEGRAITQSDVAKRDAATMEDM